MLVYVLVDYGNASVDILNAEEFESVVDHARLELEGEYEDEQDFSGHTAYDILEMYYGDEVVVHEREFTNVK